MKEKIEVFNNPVAVMLLKIAHQVEQENPKHHSIVRVGEIVRLDSNGEHVLSVNFIGFDDAEETDGE